jgi:hypothetical protein
MNARKTIVGVSWLLLTAWSSGQAASISWINGTNPPAAWTISPDHPGPSDTITFSGPTPVYSNSCVGESNLGGTPQLSIDPVSKVILLWFQGPAPQVCTLIYMPVAGLQGDFGPLAAGDWTFTSLQRDVSFEIRFTVGGSATGAYYVDHDAPGPAHDGQTWKAAFLTLQDALAVARDGEEILVAEGTYKPDRGTGVTVGDREASFVLPTGVTVRGGFAGYGQPNPDERDILHHETILSGDLNGNDLWGILNVNDNSYHVVTGPAAGAAARLDGFTVTAGRGDGTAPRDGGGGLYNPGGKLQVVNCTFEGNTAVWGGGAMNLGAVTLVNVQLIGNRALMFGGGLYNESGDAALHNGRIAGNTSDYAATVGGAAVYNLNGTVTLLDCTVADNLSPSGMAIVNFCWAPPAATTIEVANSILFNGGTEIWSNDSALVKVTYSDVQGGWSGTGNTGANPQFVAPGARGIEGQWGDGDYRLRSTSPVIDAGNNTSRPSDVLDLDADGDVAEPLPLDLDNGPRIEGSRVDMGAYEQSGKGPGPGDDIDLTICIGGNCISLQPDPNVPISSYTYIGHTTLSLEMNFKGQLSAVVTATSPAGGTWTGWLVPDIVGPGLVTTQLWVKGENLNIAALPGGSKSVQVAAVELYVVPVP